MSSIAYVTDSKMIEFHRLNGNNQLNFWKPSNSIRFADFQKGDLLFFLAKGTERNKEKGIIGYGSFDRGERMSPNQAWSRFGTLNGYHSKEDFFQAIIKTSKKTMLPKSIGCLCLKDVVYFQEPLYLSELGVMISNRIQSYTYLDRENDSVVQDILAKAKDIGVDMWSMSININSSDESVIEQDQVKDMVSKAYDFMGMGFYSESQLRKLKKFMKSTMIKLDNENKGYDWVKGSNIDCYHYENQTIFIMIPLLLLTKDTMTFVQYTMGRLFAYQSYLAINCPPNIELKLLIALAQPMDENIVSLITHNEIHIYESIE